MDLFFFKSWSQSLLEHDDSIPDLLSVPKVRLRGSSAAFAGAVYDLSVTSPTHMVGSLAIIILSKVNYRNKIKLIEFQSLIITNGSNNSYK